MEACLPGIPSMPCSMPAFWAQNPLKVPLLCGFKRLSAMMSSGEESALDDSGAEPVEEDGTEDLNVVYKAPCGLSLRNHDDVVRFLLATESCDVLQVSGRNKSTRSTRSTALKYETEVKSVPAGRLLHL